MGNTPNQHYYKKNPTSGSLWVSSLPSVTSHLKVWPLFFQTHPSHSPVTAADDHGQMLMEFLPIISVAKIFKFFFSMWKTTIVLRYKNALSEYITSISQLKFVRHVLSEYSQSKFCSNLALGAGGSLGFLSYHTKSLQTEQNVGCPKKVAINSWFLM